MAKKLLFLASGRGSNFQSFVDHIELGILRNLLIAGVVCNQNRAPVLDRARKAGIQTFEIEGVTGKKFSSPEEREEARIAFDKQCLDIVKSQSIDFVVLAGFDQIVSKKFVDAFPLKIINIHPAYDLKKFGGKNMIGSRVHESVLSSGVEYSGCTVHFVTGKVDQGPAILKRRVPVLPGDTGSKLGERILLEEHLAYPEALQLLVEGRVLVSDSGDGCFVDFYSDNWDIFWYERQCAYIDIQSKQKRLHE